MSEESKMFSVWISKYALSRGIFEENVRLCKSGSEMVCTDGVWPEYYHKEGRDWHHMKESAKQQAEKMRVARIAALKKQIAKLEKLKF